MKSHICEPSVSYVNQVTNRISPWGMMLIPAPFSEPPGGRHQSACTLNVAVGPLEAPTVPEAPAKLRGELTAVVPSRLSDRLPEGRAPYAQMSEPSPQLSEPPVVEKNPLGTTKSGVTMPSAAKPCVAIS